MFPQSELQRQTYVAPHVWGIHDQLPATRLDTKVNRTVYSMNSPSGDTRFRSLADVGLGEAR